MHCYAWTGSHRNDWWSRLNIIVKSFKPITGEFDMPKSIIVMYMKMASVVVEMYCNGKK